MDAVGALAAARKKALDKQWDLMLTETVLAQDRALAEMEIVEAAGGKLGPNPEARKRKMILGLAVHGNYQEILVQREDDWFLAERAKIEMRNAEDLVRALRVIIENV